MSSQRHLQPQPKAALRLSPLPAAPASAANQVFPKGRAGHFANSRPPIRVRVSPSALSVETPQTTRPPLMGRTASLVGTGLQCIPSRGLLAVAWRALRPPGSTPKRFVSRETESLSFAYGTRADPGLRLTTVLMFRLAAFKHRPRASNGSAKPPSSQSLRVGARACRARAAQTGIQSNGERWHSAASGTGHRVKRGTATLAVRLVGISSVCGPARACTTI